MSDILKLPSDTDQTAIRHAGCDHVVADSGTTSEVQCRVCGDAMAVRRGVVGPTGWAHAMAIPSGQAKGRRHDAYFCRFSGEAWHRQALALKLEAGKTPRKRLERLLLEEADEVILARKATMNVSTFV